MAQGIDDLLRLAVEKKASDLHLKVGNNPYVRIDGTLVPLPDMNRVTPEEMLSMAFSMMTNRQKQKFKETAELDMAYGVAGLGRFRVNVFQQRGNVGMVLRVIPTKIRTVEELNLPPVINHICEEQRGLVLVTGTTGSGKSTTLAAMIDRINADRSDHLITIEDPIEFLHRDKHSVINPDKTRLIHDAIAAGTSQYGMQTFDQSIFELYTKQLITMEEALLRASNPDEFKLRVQGVRSASDTAREEMERQMADFERFARR